MLLVVRSVVITVSENIVIMVIVIPAMQTGVKNVVHRGTLPNTVPRMDRTLTTMGARNAVLRTCLAIVLHMEHIRTLVDVPIVVAVVLTTASLMSVMLI